MTFAVPPRAVMARGTARLGLTARVIATALAVTALTGGVMAIWSVRSFEHHAFANAQASLETNLAMLKYEEGGSARASPPKARR